MLPPCRCCYVFIHSYGYDKYGYDKYGYSKSGYDKYGYGKDSYDSYGYDKHGYDKYGYNKEGYGKDSYHKDGYDRCGLTVLLGLAFLALLCGTVEFNNDRLSSQCIQHFLCILCWRWSCRQANITTHFSD